MGVVIPSGPFSGLNAVPRRLAMAFLILPLTAAAQPTLAKILSRVSEEAEVLQQNAPKILTLERLEQRTPMPAVRFRPRGGSAGVPEALRPGLQVREIVSEYSFGAVHEGPAGSLLEFRQVVSVDGREVQSPESASRALSAGILATDDRGRKRMLEAFAANALGDVATDYGLILLTFAGRSLENLSITPLGREWVGTEPALTFYWQQKTASGGALEFHGRESAHRALQGTLWVREKDGLPLRVNAWIEHTDSAKHLIRDDATVEYAMSVHGFLTPASVIHRHVVDGQTTTENLYVYEPFKLFTTSTQIKFGEPAPAPVKK
jgi:hypothetical protein